MLWHLACSTNTLMELVDQAAPATEEERKKAATDFENYHQTVINHYLAVKLYSGTVRQTGGA